MTQSPYAGKPESAWLDVTQQLVSRHPLQPPVLLDVALATWDTLWRTTVGAEHTAVRLADLRVPATIVGYFFEVLFARELERRYPDQWRGNQSADEKDLVYRPDPAQSVEIKTSGQAGLKVFGNRSHGQKVEDEQQVKKEKSGYYMTVNFFQQTLTLVRFGWIDAEDWNPQKSQTGQMAGLGKAVYKSKLIPIPGAYQRKTPVLLLDEVGQKTATKFESLGIHTVEQLLVHQGDRPPWFTKVISANQAFLAGCSGAPRG